MYSSSVCQHALLLQVSCGAVSVARAPALLIHPKPALLLGFSLVVNEDIEKILIQVVGAVMEVGYLLKCLIVVQNVVQLNKEGMKKIHWSKMKCK